MKNSLLFYASITLLFLCFQNAYSQKDWKLKKHENGIKVYTKNHKAHNLKYYKLQSTFDADYNKLTSIYLDFENYHTWIKGCIESKILKVKNEHSLIFYTKYKVPWPASDREFVSDVIISKQNNSLIITSTPSNYKYKKSKGVVRVTEYEDTWQLINNEEGTIELTLNGFYNPGGSIPAWLVNMFIVDAPYETTMKIKEMTELSD